MAGETYYFAFSIILLYVVALCVVNMLYLRVRGKTTFGLSFKPGTIEHKRVIRLADNRNITVAAVLTLAFLANLANSVNRILKLEHPDARFALVFVPALITLLGIVVFFVVRKQTTGYRFDKRH